MTNAQFGVVKFYDAAMDYGFIAPDGAAERQDDRYVHASALRRSGIDRLPAGTRVRFTMGEYKSRPQIDRLEIVDDESATAGDRASDRVAARYGE